MKFEPYKAADGWRWRLRARNRRIVADGGEAYTSRAGVKRAINATIVGMLRTVKSDGQVAIVEVAATK